jgi:hypothetical protein
VEEIYENLCTMKLEETTRAALAEAKYKQIQEKKLAATHATEGENLELTVLDNKQRGGETEEQHKQRGRKSKGSRLSRELRRISYK